MRVAEYNDIAVRTHVVRQMHQLKGVLFYLEKMGLLYKVEAAVILDHVGIIVPVDSDIRKLALEHIFQDFDFADISGMNKVFCSAIDQMVDDSFSASYF